MDAYKFFFFFFRKMSYEWNRFEKKMEKKRSEGLVY